jgi:hypothetical protein
MCRVIPQSSSCGVMISRVCSGVRTRCVPGKTTFSTACSLGYGAGRRNDPVPCFTNVVY